MSILPPKVLLALAGLFALLAVLVDFTGRIMSTIADGLLNGVAAVLVIAAFRAVKRK